MIAKQELIDSTRKQNLLYHVIIGVRLVIFIQSTCSTGENVAAQRSHVIGGKPVANPAKAFLLWRTSRFHCS